ncbi:MAG: ABC transporter permease [Proteobacteria bacterium]|nr:ABC transporter permease [Pseudomonadota bacterium]
MTRLTAKIYRLSLAGLLILSGVMAERSGLVGYLADPYEYPLLVRLFGQHLYLVALSMAPATLIGLTAGILLTRPALNRYAGPGMYVLGLGQTIPSLAVLALAMSFMGIGLLPAVFALTIYSVLPLARNTLAGISSVPRPLIEAARGMGMPPLRILFEVELPNAMPVILTGFRVALIVNIGTAALAFLIGAGGLGDLIFTGISLMAPHKLLAGAIPVTLMALAADAGCEMLGLFLISKGLRLNPD